MKRDTLQSSPPLRVGVVLASERLPAWKASIIEKLLGDDSIRLEAVLLTDEAQPARRCRPSFLYRLYERLDYQIFRRRRCHRDACAKSDVTLLLKGIPRLSGSDTVADLDVLLYLGEAPVPPALKVKAGCGVWFFRLGSHPDSCPETSLFWELFDRVSTTRTALHCLLPNGSHERVLYASYSATNQYSLQWNRNATLWRTAEFIPRCLQRLHTGGWEALHQEIPSVAAEISPVPRQAGTGTMLKFLVRHLGYFGFRTVQVGLYQEQWSLLLRSRHAQQEDDCIRITPPQGRSYADPFLLKWRGENYLFYEDFDVKNMEKGVLACMRLDKNGQTSDPIPVLQRDYHLSYPFLFVWQDELYMMPETGNNGTVEVYRATEFPHQWTLEKTLMKGSHALDSTMIEHEGKYWLFTNVRSKGFPENDELHLFSAETPFSTWTPHPKNPVVSDVRRARPAGKIFRMGNSWIRPAQDCSVRYGYALSFERIDLLTEEDYRETTVHRIDPIQMPGVIAAHTYNFNEDFEVIDQQTQIPKFSWGGCRKIQANRNPFPSHYHVINLMTLIGTMNLVSV